MKEKNKKILIILSILLCISGIIICYFALTIYEINKIVPQITSDCNISDLFNCDKEVKSKFSSLFSIPIAFFNSAVYFFSIILLIIYFFAKNDKKNLAIFGVQFFVFIMFIFSIFTFFTMLIFEKNLGFFYLFIFLINIILTILNYTINKKYLKTKLFDNKVFKTYKKEIKFNKYAIIALILLIIIIALNYIPHKIIEKNVISNYNEYNKLAFLSQDRTKEIIENFIKQTPEKIDTKDLPFFGSNNPNAIIIVKFSDFLCPYCVLFAQVLDNYLLDNPDKVKVYSVFFNFDRSFCSGDNLSLSCLSLYGAYLAYKKNKFKEYYDNLFLKRGGDKEHIIKALQSANIDPNLLNSIQKNSEAINWVKKLLQLGRNLNIDGTPTFFINGRRISGMVPINTLKQLIDKAITLK